MVYPESLEVFGQLRPGVRVELVHQVKVGFRDWTCTTVGTVVRAERRRHSLHFQRNRDDKVFSDVVVLKKDDGEITTCTLDEFTDLRILAES